MYFFVIIHTYYF